MANSTIKRDGEGGNKNINAAGSNSLEQQLFGSTLLGALAQRNLRLRVSKKNVIDESSRDIVDFIQRKLLTVNLNVNCQFKC